MIAIETIQFSNFGASNPPQGSYWRSIRPGYSPVVGLLFSCMLSVYVCVCVSEREREREREQLSFRGNGPF